MTFRIRYSVLCLVTCLLAQPGLAQYFPPKDGEWAHITTDEVGADPRLLDAAMELAEEKNSKGVVVLYQGKILAEQYWDGWTKDSAGPMYSATKSIAATLVGMAIESGDIESLDQSCSDFLHEWRFRPRYKRIQIQHLLSMTSGLKNSLKISIAGGLARSERAFTTRLPIAHKPGEYWDYHNSAYHMLFPILEEATGVRLDEYTESKLANPLGMEHARWRTRVVNRNEFNFMEMSTRDAARFGLLIERGGKWQGNELVSLPWVVGSALPFDKKVNPSYGRLWWLNGGEYHYLPFIKEPQRGPLFKGVPADAFAALGRNDQKIYIVPSLDLVVTRLGDAAGDDTYALSEFDSPFLSLICNSLNADGE